MQTKIKNDLFNLFIYGTYVSVVYGITLLGSTYFGIGGGLILVLGLAVIVHGVFQFRYLELFRGGKSNE